MKELKETALYKKITGASTLLPSDFQQNADLFPNE